MPPTPIHSSSASYSPLIVAGGLAGAPSERADPSPAMPWTGTTEGPHSPHISLERYLLSSSQNQFLVFILALVGEKPEGEFLMA